MQKQFCRKAQGLKARGAGLGLCDQARAWLSCTQAKQPGSKRVLFSQCVVLAKLMATQVLSELDSLQHFLAETSAECRQQQCELWCRKFESMQTMDSSSGLELVKKVKAGIWSNEQKKMLIAAINQSVLRATTVTGTRRSSQVVNDFSRYFTEGDVQTLADEQIPFQTKLDTLVCRLVRLGIHLPSETSLGLILKTAQMCGMKCGDGTPSANHTALNELKRQLRSATRPLPRPQQHVERYPADPAQLAEWLYKAAYAQEAPVAMEVDSTEIASQATSLPLRNTNKLLAKRATATSKDLMPSGGSSPDPMQMMGSSACQMMFKFMMQMASRGMAGGEGELNLHHLKPQHRKRTHACLADVPEETEKEDPLSKAAALPVESNPAASGSEQRAKPPAAASPQQLALELPAPAAPALSLPAPKSAEEMEKLVKQATSNRTKARRAAAEVAESQDAANRKQDPKAQESAKAKATKPKAKAKAKAKAAKTAAQAASSALEKAELRPAAPVDPAPKSAGELYGKMWYSATNKAAIKHKRGGQICQFGRKGQPKDALYKIAQEAMELMAANELPEADCKAFCEQKATEVM